MLNGVDVKATLKRTASTSLSAAQLTGTQALFSILGPTKISNLGANTAVAIASGANTLKIRFTPTGGSLTDLCSATDTASAALQQLFFVDGAKATALVKTTDVGILAAGQALHMPIVVGPGVIYAVFSGGPPATGQLDFFMEYEPIAGDGGEGDGL